MIVRYNDEKMVYESIFSRVPDPKVLEEIDYEVSGWDQASDKIVKKYVISVNENKKCSFYPPYVLYLGLKRV